MVWARTFWKQDITKLKSVTVHSVQVSGQRDTDRQTCSWLAYGRTEGREFGGENGERGNERREIEFATGLDGYSAECLAMQKRKVL